MSEVFFLRGGGRGVGGGGQRKLPHGNKGVVWNVVDLRHDSIIRLAN